MSTTNIIIRSVLKNTQSYIDYAGKVVAFVFKGFTGLVSINTIPIASIATVPNVNGRVKFETVVTYTPSGTEWMVPGNNLGKFTVDSDTFYVVFGYVNASGYINSTAGTCGTDITLVIDNDYIPEELTNCKVDALPSRSDCSPIDATSIYQIVGYDPGVIPIQVVEIPV